MTWNPVSAGEPRGKGGKQGRNATGRKAIPPGVAAAVQAEVLAGEPIKPTARKYGVSPDYVRRLANDVKDTDPDAIMELKRKLPSRLTILAAGATERAIEAVEQDDAVQATKWTFASKLAIEGNRWAQPAADNPGATLLAFIDALGKVGGGSLTVGPLPPGETPTVIVHTTAEEVADAGSLDGPAALHGDV